jgi:hypothetical protein
VTITLSDPCDPPVKLIPITLEDQRYTITDEKKSYTHGDVVADPAYCPVRYEYLIEKLNNGNEPITFGTVDKQIDIHYEADLTPLNETPLIVTVKAISDSKYGATIEKEAISVFKVNFDNPCIDQEFVTIENAPFSNIEYTITSAPETFTHQ